MALRQTLPATGWGISAVENKAYSVVSHEYSLTMKQNHTEKHLIIAGSTPNFIIIFLQYDSSNRLNEHHGN
ncbi:hypothetical protein [Burkholderia singularis]|nr:hypothetical protein [Burkholderia singularis]